MQVDLFDRFFFITKQIIYNHKERHLYTDVVGEKEKHVVNSTGSLYL